MDGTYGKGVGIVGVLTFILVFIGSWIYCIATYGFLLGVGLGWLPALITAAVSGAIIGFLWPIALLGVLILIYNLLIRQ